MSTWSIHDRLSQMSFYDKSGMLRCLFCFKTENSRPAKNNTLRRSTYDLRKSAAMLFMYLHLVTDSKVSVIRVSSRKRNFLILCFTIVVISFVGCRFLLLFLFLFLFALLIMVCGRRSGRLSTLLLFRLSRALMRSIRCLGD